MKLSKGTAAPALGAGKCDGCSTGTRPPRGWNLLELWSSSSKSGTFNVATWQLCLACSRRLKLRGPVLLPTHDRRAKR